MCSIVRYRCSPKPIVLDFYSEETVNNQGLECLRFLNEVISDFDAVSTMVDYNGKDNRQLFIEHGLFTASGTTALPGHYQNQNDRFHVYGCQWTEPVAYRQGTVVDIFS